MSLKQSSMRCILKDHSRDIGREKNDRWKPDVLCLRVQQPPEKIQFALGFAKDHTSLHGEV